MKSVRIWSYSGPYFLALGLNKFPYSVQILEFTDTSYAVADINRKVKTVLVRVIRICIHD